MWWLALGLGSVVVMGSIAWAGEGAGALQAPSSLKAGEALTMEAKAVKPLKAKVLVELFTSEGCSSCPPADELLIKLEADAQAKGRDVIPLSFHVDYWDRLGWADPFAKADFTQRQRAYAQRFDWGTFTPQVVIGGQVNMVGSHSRRVWAGVDRALQGHANTEVDLGGTWSGDRRSLEVRYDVRPRWSGPLVLNIVVAEGERQVSVERGENKGRTLKHGNVVRALETVEMTGPKAGSLKVELPKDWASSKLLLTAFAQDPASKAILGAQVLRFKTP